MSPSRSVLFLLFVTTLGCGLPSMNTAPTWPRVSPEAVSILAGGTRVETFRLDGMEGGEESLPNLGTRMCGLPVTAHGKDQGPEFAAKLKGLVSDEENYIGPRVACFWPGVGFRVWKGHESVEVLVCFKCGNFYCGPPTKAIPHEQGTFKGKPLYGRFVRLARESFPDDKDIQSLKE